MSQYAGSRSVAVATMQFLLDTGDYGRDTLGSCLHCRRLSRFALELASCCAGGRPSIAAERQAEGGIVCRRNHLRSRTRSVGELQNVSLRP